MTPRPPVVARPVPAEAGDVIDLTEWARRYVAVVRSLPRDTVVMDKEAA